MSHKVCITSLFLPMSPHQAHTRTHTRILYAHDVSTLILILSNSSAYGAVYKAKHKESNQLLAIKQVPVDSDLQDIIKEISIMQQCDRYLAHT